MAWVKIAKDLLIAIPVAHLTFSTTYLLAYHQGFGKSISAFASASDIFSVSLREVGRTYFIMLGIFLVGTVYFRAKYGYYTKADYVKSLDVKHRDKAEAEFLRDRNFLKWTAVFIVVSGGVAVSFWWYVEQKIPYALASMPVMTSVLLGLIWTANRIGWNNFEFFLAIILTLLFLNCLFRGLVQGQDDRYAVYRAQVNENPTCGRFVVLRPLGEKFLALRTDDRAVLIDADCKVRFELPVVRRPKPRKLYGLPLDR